MQCTFQKIKITREGEFDVTEIHCSTSRSASETKDKHGIHRNGDIHDA